MPIKKKKHTHSRRKQKSKLTALSNKKTKIILRTLPDNQAFHFYTEIDKPTNQVAKSLLDFYSIINSDKSHQTQTSLTFHMKRGDLTKWIKEAIGDTKLAAKISKLSPKDPRLGKKLNRTVNDRISQLRETLVECSIIPEDNYATIFTR